MGNCLRIRRPSKDHHPKLTKSNDSGPGSPTFTNASSTAYATARSQFSETVSQDGGQILPAANLKMFTFADLKKATGNFKAGYLLDKKELGQFFTGWIDERTFAPSKPGSGMAVTVKKVIPDSMQGFKQWQSEVAFLGRLFHPNLIKLLGYCREDKELFLVYEFMQKGSLETNLFGKFPTTELLSWNLRLKIAIGAARGLAFLLNSEKQVFYRGFTLSNILLDGNYNAKISDFGLSKLEPREGHSHAPMVTYGYAAPEYIATGHLSMRSDVYGFGVVLLEMMTGLRAVDSKRPDGQKILVEWLKPSLSHKRKLNGIMDARMEGQYSTKDMLQVAQITLRCLEPDPGRRPYMEEVVDALEKIALMKEEPR